MEVRWFGYMEEVVCNGGDLILNPLFNFELIEGLENWVDMRMLGNTSNGTCKSILNMLKALNWNDGEVKEVALIEA